MNYADMHCHMLYGVDDGAQDRETSRAMLDAAYADGTRTICFTPHCHPGYYGEHADEALQRYAELRTYAAERYPDLALYLGNELHDDPACLSWLDAGTCRTLNGSRYLLVDFSDDVSLYTITKALDQLLNAGYTPVLAHTEVYRSLRGDTRTICSLSDSGVILQLDSQSIMGDFGLGAKRAARRLLCHGLADIVASDAHDMDRRPPRLSACHAFVAEKYGEAYAGLLFADNPQRILRGEYIGKD